MDPVEQRAPIGASNISIGLGVPGLGKNHGWDRPDTNAAIGDTQIVEGVNAEYAVDNKTTGALEIGPIDGNLIWQNLGGVCYACL